MCISIYCWSAPVVNHSSERKKNVSVKSPFLSNIIQCLCIYKSFSPTRPSTYFIYSQHNLATIYTQTTQFSCYKCERRKRKMGRKKRIKLFKQNEEEYLFAVCRRELGSHKVYSKHRHKQQAKLNRIQLSNNI